MAILAILNCKGYTKDIYEKIRREVDWEVTQPTGLILHTAAFDPGGTLRVADIWESEQTMKTFFDTRLKPAVEKHNLSPPVPEIFPLHNANAFEGISRFAMQTDPFGRTG